MINRQIDLNLPQNGAGAGQQGSRERTDAIRPPQLLRHLETFKSEDVQAETPARVAVR